jgi:hypothetical protein
MEVNNNTNEGTNSNIMRELSGIKSSLAVQTAETVNIKGIIGEIKSDIKEIKTGYINQEQHKTLVDCIAEHNLKIASIETRASELERSKIRQNVMMSIGIAILSLLVSLLIYHIVH